VAHGASDTRHTLLSTPQLNLRKFPTCLLFHKKNGSLLPSFSLALLLLQYLNNSAAVIYMVDMSDSFQLGASAAHFHHICSLPTVTGKPILLVLNKMDSPVSVFSLPAFWFSSPSPRDAVCFRGAASFSFSCVPPNRFPLICHNILLLLPRPLRVSHSSVCCIEGRWRLCLRWSGWRGRWETA
jgi:hypothetical protein